MIILCPIKCNTNFKDFLSKYNSIINLPYLECPVCNSTELIRWGSYERNVNYIDENVIMYTTIKIQRVRCNKCSHTHALIPSCIVPYKISTLDVILSGINNDEITLSFSFDTIDKWKKIFNKFLPYLKTIFLNILKSQIISRLKQGIFKYFEYFYNFTKKVLMMTHKGIVSMSYF